MIIGLWGGIYICKQTCKQTSHINSLLCVIDWDMLHGQASLGLHDDAQNPQRAMQAFGQLLNSWYEYVHVYMYTLYLYHTCMSYMTIYSSDIQDCTCALQTCTCTAWLCQTRVRVWSGGVAAGLIILDCYSILSWLLQHFLSAFKIHFWSFDLKTVPSQLFQSRV